MLGLGPLSAAVVGAIDDGLEGYFCAAWRCNQPELAIATYRGEIVITTAEDGRTLLSTAATPNSAAGPQVSWIGKPIAITVGSAIFQTTVTYHFYDVRNSNRSTVVLADVPPSALIGRSEQTLACPCFTPYYEGKTVWVHNGEKAPATFSEQTTNPLYACAMTATIRTVVDPFRIVLDRAFGAPTPVAGAISLVRWGTNNTAAIAAAAVKALELGRSGFAAPGWAHPASTGLYFMFDAVPNDGSYDETAANASLALNALHIWTSESTLVAMSHAGQRGQAGSGRLQDVELTRRGGHAAGSAPPAPERGVYGPQSWRRCNSADSLVLVITGDSWGSESPAGTAGDSPIHELKRALERANPAKRITWINRARGGSTIRDLTSHTPLRRDANLPWITCDAHPWSHYIVNTEYGPPDAVFVIATGANDGLQISQANIHAAINMFKAAPLRNGLPVDVVFVSGAWKHQEFWNPGLAEYRWREIEYAIGMIDSTCRTAGVPVVALGPTFGFANHGWYPTQMRLRQVPPLPEQAITANTPLHVPFLCRDFCLVLKLVGASGADFWRRAGGVEITLSAKPDNRVIIRPDAEGHLQVLVTAWGRSVRTPVTIDRNATALTTGGHIAFNPNNRAHPAAPAYIYVSTGSFVPAMVGQCMLFEGCGFEGRPVRTYVMSFTHSGIVFGCDPNDQQTVCEAAYWGGQMFVPFDAVAGNGTGADVMFSHGGTTYAGHVAAYGDFQNVTLDLPWTGDPLQDCEVDLFVGKTSFGPGYTVATPAGCDPGANPLLIVERRGSRLRVGYVLGTRTTPDTRKGVQDGTVPVWQGEIDITGGPFNPRIFISNGTPEKPVSVVPVDVRIGEPILYQPSMTSREVMGTPDPIHSWPTGGDSSHISMEAVARLVAPVMDAQDFSMQVAATQAPGGILSATVGNDGPLVTLPPNARLNRIYVQNLTNHAIPGGIHIGTTAGGSDVASADTIGPNVLVRLGERDLRAICFGATVGQPLYISATAGWTAAELAIDVVFDR